MDVWRAVDNGRGRRGKIELEKLVYTRQGGVETGRKSSSSLGTACPGEGMVALTATEGNISGGSHLCGGRHIGGQHRYLGCSS